MEEEISKGVAVVTIDIPNNDSVNKKTKKHRKSLVQDMFYDYARNTTLHGLSYTTKNNVTITEKVFWVITFLTSLCLCTYVIHDVWMKWQKKPIIVSLSEKYVPVQEVPFPSVTICPQTKVVKSVYDYESEAKNLIQIWETKSDDDIQKNIKDFVKFEDVSQICSDIEVYLQMHYKLYFTKYEKEKLMYTKVEENILKVSPHKNDIFMYCMNNGKVDGSCELFSEVITSEGLCYNINSLAAHEIIRDGINIHFKAQRKSVNWTMEHGYSYYSPTTYPTPGNALGETPDLSILFRHNSTKYDERCNAASTRFIKVFIQHPADLPQSSQYFASAQIGASTSVALSFDVINTAEELKKYSPEIRQCYLPEERKLKFFKIYTENNCVMECEINQTYNKYKCAGFYMPHENITRICTFTEIISELSDVYRNGAAIQETKKCNCLPSCYSIDYKAETLKVDYDLRKQLTIQNIPMEPDISYSSLQIFFKGARFISMRRSELFGVTDFLANIGGVLSLFLGFSFLSLVEVLYYVTLRLYFIFKNNHKQDKIKENILDFPK